MMANVPYLYLIVLSIMASNHLRVGCWNCRGLRSSIPYIRELLDNQDVLAVSEHWLSSNRLRELDNIVDTHQVHARSSRLHTDNNSGAGRRQGGIAIFCGTILMVSPRFLTLSTIGFAPSDFKMPMDKSIFSIVSISRPKGPVKTLENALKICPN